MCQSLNVLLCWNCGGQGQASGYQHTLSIDQKINIFPAATECVGRIQMDIEFISKLIKENRLQWQRHALERMIERGIARSDVKHVLTKGEIIEDYPDDDPFPSLLVLGFVNEKPLHVVTGIDKDEKWCYIITVYKPDPNHFEPDFKTRKQ